MQFIDSHIHLQDYKANNAPHFVADMQGFGLEALICPSICEDDWDKVIEFAKKNMGIICVSKQYITKELENQELKIIPIKEKLDLRSISLAFDNDNISHAAKRFMEIL